MGLFTRGPSRGGLPPEITVALALASGERVLAFGVDDNTGVYVVATNFALAVVSVVNGTSRARTSTAEAPGPQASGAGATRREASAAEGTRGETSAVERSLRRPWLFVDAGAWEPETATLTVTWTDRGRAGQWSFRDQPTRLPETLRERVQASVVISTRLDLGDRRTGRVAIRQDFETRELIPQTLLGRYTRADDPEVQAHVRAALAHLRDQVGLPA
jgi:hypothetical protein